MSNLSHGVDNATEVANIGAVRSILWVSFLVLVWTAVPVSIRAADWKRAAGPADGLSYGRWWKPPGQSQAWKMDCSNAVRWMVRSQTGISLPRSASDQYLMAKEQGKLWRISPKDTRALRKRLRPGDLLFWEYTYKPVRKPPVTHVMIYAGTDAQGRWLMTGASTRAGVGLFPFNPTQSSGGYRYFFGLFKKSGRFAAVGRI